MDLSKLPLRWIRLRAVWILVPLFVVLADPTPTLVLAGLPVALAGVAVRSWASGVIVKDERLTTAGPYAFTRNPLYLGSFLLGLGLVIAAGSLVVLALYVLLFFGIYGVTMRREAEYLEERFGEAYRAYAERVPVFLPTPVPYRGGAGSEGGEAGFAWERYRKHREHQSVLALVLGFGVLLAKWWWLG